MRVIQEIRFGELIDKIKGLDIPAESMVRVVIESKDEEKRATGIEEKDAALDALFGLWADREVDAGELRKKAWARGS